VTITELWWCAESWLAEWWIRRRLTKP